MTVSKKTYITYFENLRGQLHTQGKLEGPILQFRQNNLNEINTFYCVEIQILIL